MALLAPLARRAAILALFASSSCGAPTPGTPPPASLPPSAPSPPSPAATPLPAAALPAPAASVDPLPGALTVESVRALCDRHLAAAEAHRARLAGLDGQPPSALTVEATLLRFDDAIGELATASGVPYLMGVAHVIHNVLTTSTLASYSGANTAQDFVEAPSQMFEEWAWSRASLDRFARHHETGAKIPDALFAAMKASRTFGRALATARHVFLARVDFEYHVRAPGFDTTKVLAELESRGTGFRYVPGSHFQTCFEHLTGYGAGYYGYQWALSIAQDALTRFAKEGYLNPVTAAAWRDEVLAKGGGEDPREMLARFLGRPPSDAAYAAFLAGKSE